MTWKVCSRVGNACGLLLSLLPYCFSCIYVPFMSSSRASQNGCLSSFFVILTCIWIASTRNLPRGCHQIIMCTQAGISDLIPLITLRAFCGLFRQAIRHTVPRYNFHNRSSTMSSWTCVVKLIILFYRNKQNIFLSCQIPYKIMPLSTTEREREVKANSCNKISLKQIGVKNNIESGIYTECYLCWKIIASRLSTPFNYPTWSLIYVELFFRRIAVRTNGISTLIL